MVHIKGEFVMSNAENGSLEELIKVFKILLKHLKTIIITTIITILIFGVAIFTVIKPKYQSTAEIIVNQKLGKNSDISLQQQAQATDLQLVNTYKSILNSETIGNSVKKKVGKDEYNQSELDVETDLSSQVISINVTSHNAYQAAKIANTTATVFKQKINKIMDVNNVSVISKAMVNNKVVFPKKSLSLILGLVVGLVIGSILALFKEYNDKTITNIDYITNNLGLVDLGTISDIDMKNIKKNLKK